MSRINGTRENVKVVCRLRPQNAKETAQGGSTCTKSTNTTIEVNIENEGPYSFQFDRVFGFDSDQKTVFEETAIPLVNDVLQGYNATIFAYGQTGTGKTYTMEGVLNDPQLKGIIPRSVEALFEGVLEADENIEFTFKISYIEIYMERIRDLLDDSKSKVNLMIREDKIKGIHITGVTEEYVTSVEEILQVMGNGAMNRATAATGMNEGSSRSHSVFTITVTQRDVTNNATKSGKLILVDLAGSETVKKTGATGQQLEEAKTINKSLSALGNVINALTDKKSTHIPYRDSKLTRLLEDSLGGNSKSTLIINISPSSYNAAESISTLRFGTRAKNIENKVTVNQTRTAVELELLLSNAEKTIENQAALIAKLKGGSTEDININTDNDYLNQISELNNQIQSLISDLDEERVESTRKDADIIALTNLINEKDIYLNEASDLLSDAQMQKENQIERFNELSREKVDLLSQLESLKSTYQDEISKLKFNFDELQVNYETISEENAHLRKELSEISGDNMDSRSHPPLIDTSNQLPLQGSVSNDLNSLGALQNQSSTSLSAAADNYADDISSALSKSSTVREDNKQHVDLEKFEEQFQALCSEFVINEDAALSIWNIIRTIVIQFESVVTSYRSQTEILQKVRHDSHKRLKEIDVQRSRLERDLQMRTEKVLQQQLQIDDIRQMNAAQLAEYFHEKDRSHMKSLQQRLEQLVAVHRQLLRKFASLELDNNEFKKKIQLRDERIRQLESNARTISGNMRQQAERHVAELSNLREQIQLLRAEHQKRLDTVKGLDSSAVGSNQIANMSFHKNLHEKSKSIRGRGGNKSTQPGSQDEGVQPFAPSVMGGGATSLFSRFLGGSTHNS